jgi:DtxR family Mn-dependent transcriptional regulator
MLSSSKKKYLFAICKLGIDGNMVQSSNIARYLKVKRPSVSKMLKVLSSEGLIEKECYGKITFTPQGLQIANRLYTNYLFLFEYFFKYLQLSEANASHDAFVCIC